jgi:hypothetical protein
MRSKNYLTIWGSIVIFISGYIPLFFIMIIKDIDFVGTLKFRNPFIVNICLVLSIVSGLALYYVIKNIENKGFPVLITSVKHKSSEIVNYTIPYMISFFAFDFSKKQDLIVFAIFLILLCVLSIRSQSIFLNPLLATCGYGLYECNYIENNIEKDGIIISSYALSKGKNYKIKKISAYVAFVSQIPEENINE